MASLENGLAFWVPLCPAHHEREDIPFFFNDVVFSDGEEATSEVEYILVGGRERVLQLGRDLEGFFMLRAQFGGERRFVCLERTEEGFFVRIMF